MILVKYSYFDNKECKTLFGEIQLSNRKNIKKHILENWKKKGYQGEINSIEIEEIESIY